MMDSENTKKTFEVSQDDLARLGGGALGYIREIEDKEAARLMGGRPVITPGSKLFCLYHADGSPISISGSREDAVGSAVQHELVAMSVH